MSKSTKPVEVSKEESAAKEKLKKLQEVDNIQIASESDAKIGDEVLFVETTKEVKAIELLIADFVGKQKGEYSLNDFLKTVPQTHDTVTHLKQLGGIITKLKLKVKDNSHLQLGKNYYEVGTAKQLHYGLDDVDIVVEK